MDQPQLLVVADLKGGENSGEEEPVAGGTMCIAVGFNRLGIVAVIVPVVGSKQRIYHHRDS
jgi:hypothetical protein